MENKQDRKKKQKIPDILRFIRRIIKMVEREKKIQLYHYNFIHM